MSEHPSRYVLGVDFGTLSARAVVVDALSGDTLGVGEHAYSHAVLEEALPDTTTRLDALWALQVPADYLQSLEISVTAALQESGVPGEGIEALAIDFTACTVLPVLADGTPLCELERFANSPHAYVKLWKHHAAQDQADRINELAATTNQDWLARYGGKLSSEWQLAKGLQIFEDDSEIYTTMDHLVEATDWVTWQMTGTFVRNEALAGYKGTLQDGSYPDSRFLEQLGTGFGTFCADKLGGPLAKIGEIAGHLLPQVASKLGLPAGTPIAVGNVDAHVAAPVASAVEAGQLLAVMGTSTCHILNSPELRLVEGMCGVVADGAVPGLWGYEAGQSGVGDIFAWFIDTCVPQSVSEEARNAGISVHDHLTSLASELAIGEHGLVALDWWSGNRSTLVDHELSGLILGLTLATRSHHIYRCLLEATAFGTRTIVDAFESAGVPVNELFVAGGLSKNRLLMQMTADILRLPVSLVESDQGPAFGSAMQAAVACGIHADILVAARSMSSVTRSAFTPNPRASEAYDELYTEYSALVDDFGREGGKTMKRLLRIRRLAQATQPGLETTS